MNETHILYENIIHMVVNMDKRSLLPEPGERMDLLLDLVADDAEKDTEVFTIQVDDDDDI